MRYLLLDEDGVQLDQAAIAELPHAPEAVPAQLVGVIIHKTSGPQPELELVLEVDRR